MISYGLEFGKNNTLLENFILMNLLLTEEIEIYGFTILMCDDDGDEGHRSSNVGC